MTDLKKPVRRKLGTVLSCGFGPDRGRRLVVTLRPGAEGDLIELRPERTRCATVILRLLDVYAWGVRCAAGRNQLERARARKARLAATREARSLRRAEKRLVTG
jgi:hypothetical protein